MSNAFDRPVPTLAQQQQYMIDAVNSADPAELQAADEDDSQTCLGCGEVLSAVGWLFDPCPEDEDGSHRAAS